MNTAIPNVVILPYDSFKVVRDLLGLVEHDYERRVCSAGPQQPTVYGWKAVATYA